MESIFVVGAYRTACDKKGEPFSSVCQQWHDAFLLAHEQSFVDGIGANGASLHGRVPACFSPPNETAPLARPDAPPSRCPDAPTPRRSIYVYTNVSSVFISTTHQMNAALIHPTVTQ